MQRRGNLTKIFLHCYGKRGGKCLFVLPIVLKSCPGRRQKNIRPRNFSHMRELVVTSYASGYCTGVVERLARGTRNSARKCGGRYRVGEWQRLAQSPKDFWLVLRQKLYQSGRNTPAPHIQKHHRLTFLLLLSPTKKHIKSIHPKKRSRKQV